MFRKLKAGVTAGMVGVGFLAVSGIAATVAPAAAHAQSTPCPVGWTLVPGSYLYAPGLTYTGFPWMQINTKVLPYDVSGNMENLTSTVTWNPTGGDGPWSHLNACVSPNDGVQGAVQFQSAESGEFLVPSFFVTGEQDPLAAYQPDGGGYGTFGFACTGKAVQLSSNNQAPVEIEAENGGPNWYLDTSIGNTASPLFVGGLCGEPAINH